MITLSRPAQALGVRRRMPVSARSTLVRALFLLLLGGLFPIASAQGQERGNWAMGFLGGATIAVSEGDEVTPSFGFRAMLRFMPVRVFQMELGAGYLFYKDEHSELDYFAVEGTAIPIDLRIVLAPLSGEVVSPFVTGGFGMTLYSIDEEATPLMSIDTSLSATGSYFHIPVGIGLTFNLSKKFAIELQGINNLGLNDELNPATDGENDGLWQAMAGFVFTLGDRFDRDTDGDMLTDSDEKRRGTDHENPDTDGDGLTDGAEVLTHTTDPLKPDTDGDGLNDGPEVSTHRTKPLNPDTDEDGLTDGSEVNTHRTNPLEEDTDGDELTDGAEVNTHSTKPLEKDTDGDGLNDGAEVNTHSTKPLERDTDGDGLTDGDEVNTHKTKPLEQDTDKDGLTDGAEVNTHKTRPLEEDTDKDGLTDGAEVNTHRTNPNNSDTDAGGVNDGAEIARAINPLNASDDVTVREVIVERETIINTVFDTDTPLVLKGIVFETGKADIKPESEATLNEVLTSLRDNPDVRVEISGHTDNVGADESNLTLSLDRANSVRQWLVDHGIPQDQIETKGMGETQPTATNDTPEGRQLNRRIEMRRIN